MNVMDKNGNPILNTDGTLKDPSRLITNKVIGSTAKLSFPVYDIDDKAVTSGFAPEIDSLSFNGEFIKTLSGFNNTWVNDSFSIDIGKVRFKSSVSPNAVNEVQVDIDTANVGNGEFWCMAVDWVAIEFDASVPYVLAHGIAADAGTWDEKDAPGVLSKMNDSGVLYTRFSTANKNGSVAANALDLKAKIRSFLNVVKSKKVNIIAHSKGGLDSQALAKLSQPDFQVLSLSTLSTPHRGSVVADLQILQRALVTVYVNQGQDPNGYAQKYVNSTVAGIASGFGAGPQPPGLNDLTTQAASAAILAGLRGNVANTFTIGADAGPNCTRQPTDQEIAPMADAAPFGFKTYTNNILRLGYQSICDFSSAVQLNFQVLPSFDPSVPPVTVLTYSTVVGAAKQPNDIVVGVRSANPGWGTPFGDNAGTNHSEVKNGTNVQKFLDQTIKLR
jgi:hypothetical protein